MALEARVDGRRRRNSDAATAHPGPASPAISPRRFRGRHRAACMRAAVGRSSDSRVPDAWRPPPPPLPGAQAPVLMAGSFPVTAAGQCRTGRDPCGRASPGFPFHPCAGRREPTGHKIVGSSGAVNRKCCGLWQGARDNDQAPTRSAGRHVPLRHEHGRARGNVRSRPAVRASPRGRGRAGFSRRGARWPGIRRSASRSAARPCARTRPAGDGPGRAAAAPRRRCRPG